MKHDCIKDIMDSGALGETIVTNTICLQMIAYGFYLHSIPTFWTLSCSINTQNAVMNHAVCLDIACWTNLPFISPQRENSHPNIVNVN